MTTPSDPKNEKPDIGALLVERWRYEDETLAQRTDWFLVFHAILLEAFFGASTLGLHLLVATFGVCTGFTWAWVGMRHRWDHQHLARILQESDHVGPERAQAFRGIQNFRRTQPWWMKFARATPAFAIFIPVATTIVWIGCLTTVADHFPDVLGQASVAKAGWTSLITLLVVVISAGTISLLGDRPVFSKTQRDDLLPQENSDESKNQGDGGCLRSLRFWRR